MENSKRIEYLRRIISIEGDIGDSISALKEFSYDVSEPLITVTAADVRAMLLIAMSRNDYELPEKWASFLEMRDDVDLEEANEDLVRAAIFEFANPELTGQGLPELLSLWIKKFNLDS